MFSSTLKYMNMNMNNYKYMNIFTYLLFNYYESSELVEIKEHKELMLIADNNLFFSQVIIALFLILYIYMKIRKYAQTKITVIKIKDVEQNVEQSVEQNVEQSVEQVINEHILHIRTNEDLINELKACLKESNDTIFKLISDEDEELLKRQAIEQELTNSLIDAIKKIRKMSNKARKENKRRNNIESRLKSSLKIKTTLLKTELRSLENARKIIYKMSVEESRRDILEAELQARLKEYEEPKIEVKEEKPVFFREMYNRKKKENAKKKSHKSSVKLVNKKIVRIGWGKKWVKK